MPIPSSGRTIRVLSFSTLFPNSQQPAHGVFVWRRLREVLATGRIEAKVVAPVPWFPVASERFGEYGRFAAVPHHERRESVEIFHPRYVVVPKIGMRITPYTLALGALRTLHTIRASGFDFDLIDAHYFYPDGVAAALLGRWLRRPVLVTARGTDINLIPRDVVARKLILRAHKHSAASIAVCQALKDEMVQIGMNDRRIYVLRNGVDLQQFQPVDRSEARQRLGLEGSRVMLSVGLLIERKGHDIAIRALQNMPDWRLLIAGDGPLHASLAALAQECGVARRVHFAGLVPTERLPLYYSAADLLVLASSREGWANVLLESMACGTPVVATSVWGTPEVVATPAAGVLMQDRTAEALVQAVARLIANYPTRESTRAYAEAFGWAPTTHGQIELFERVTAAAK
jgi:teichuronic acid biosynthesis glycosyltransferase TuaC